MFHNLTQFTHWLHTQWPEGRVEKLPVVGTNGETNIPGLFICGDLTGIPLLKFALDSGAKTVRHLVTDGWVKPGATRDPNLYDLVIIGAGVSGFAAAVEAQRHGLSFLLLESTAPLSTLLNFPRAKPIYTYPNEMTPQGDLQVSADIKESLIEELKIQIEKHGIQVCEAHAEKVQREGNRLEVTLTGKEKVWAKTVIAALGRSGNHRKLEVSGENLDKVSNRLHDPKDFAGQRTLVVGGGDTALETATALADAGSKVTLSYRRKAFSRPKSENVERLSQWESMQDATGQGGSLTLRLATTLQSIDEASVRLVDDQGNSLVIENDFVFTMIGRDPPLDFFRRSGVRIQGEWGIRNYATLTGFLLFCVWMYLWKSSGNLINDYWVAHTWFPYNLEGAFDRLLESPQTLAGTLALSMTQPAFYYGLVYSVIVTVFGALRIRRRKTPYITRQTVVLILVQVIPLFILPSILLPWLGHNDLLPKTFADTFFPVADYDPHGREYWRASGFVLAWPLFIHNVFTNEPLWGWLFVCFLQTFVLIPAMIYYWGKGAYCGWICSCGALAETLGDTHRTKMPHGPEWNRLNMAGQLILGFGFLLLLLRILGWVGVPGMGGVFYFLSGKVYKFGVDIFLSGILGVGLYFWYSGRVWCRFFCPLAALMHLYARFSRFRIFSDKKKCISCNVCTSVCHQGIDVMNFANKGIPMEDPECVRCSACVQSCPTGVLAFGQVDPGGGGPLMDRTPASPVQMREKAMN